MHHMPVLQPRLHYYRQMKRQQGQASEVLSPKQAAKELGVKVETFKAFMDSGLIEVTPPPLSPPPTPPALLMPEGPLSTRKKPERSYRIAIISIDSVRKLSATRRSQLSLVELASRLGVHGTVARSLVSAGLLQVSRGTYGRGRAITTGEINRFLESVCGSAPVRPIPQGQPGVLNLRGAWHAGNYYLVHLPRLQSC
jgi:hypothetical protein